MIKVILLVSNQELVKIVEGERKELHLFLGEIPWKKVPKSLYRSLLQKKDGIEFGEYILLEKKLCVQYAASLLARRGCTSGMLRTKLSEKRFERGSMQYAIDLLQTGGYLDDEKRVEAAIEKYARSGYGPAYMRAKLQQTLKLSQEAASNALARYCTQELEESALEVAIKKNRGKNIYSALLRRGFSSEMVAQSLRMCNSDFSE